jgi:hypothetical protein
MAYLPYDKSAHHTGFMEQKINTPSENDLLK